jgi:carotenoid cleavage dioxygenase-like enzyme
MRLTSGRSKSCKDRFPGNLRVCISARLGEPVFAPAGLAAAEDQGYVVTFATDAATLQSYFLILHAGDIAGEPAATLRIPHRVPAGFHGCWVPGN